jgi:1-deoxy-D-xylulose-5-phosphate reductoisomerase
MNAANEIVVEAFMNNRVKFLEMPVIIEHTMDRIDFIATPSLEDLQMTDSKSRRVAEALLA